ncbi:MAG TPA: formyltransferase family protein [Ktedonobacterales bacterium]
MSGLRVVFFGLGGVFSRLPLEALLRADADLRAVVTLAQPGMTLGEAADQPFIRLESRPIRPARLLPLAGGAAAPRSLRDLAAEARAPLLSVARLRDPATLEALASFAPDAICVACFTRRLPPALLRLPRLGCLNAHPSLLPDNRGPDPLFWTFHAGATTTGATIHLMDDAFDAGPILAQASVALAEGETEELLETRLAALAGELMVSSLAGLASGALTPTPQDAALATAHPWPEPDDYRIPAAEWSARRAYSFACGVSGREQRITLVAADGARFHLREPLSYDLDAALAAPWRRDGDRLTLACAPGVLRCHIAQDAG